MFACQMAWWRCQVDFCHLWNLLMNLSSGGGLVRTNEEINCWNSQLMQCVRFRMILFTENNIYDLFQAPLLIQRRISVPSFSCGWIPKILLLRYQILLRCYKYYTTDFTIYTILCCYVYGYHCFKNSLSFTDRKRRHDRNDFSHAESVRFSYLQNIAYIT